MADSKSKRWPTAQTTKDNDGEDGDMHGVADGGDDNDDDDAGDEGDGDTTGEAIDSTLARDGFVFQPLGPELMSSDAWDDSALIKAWDKAVRDYQTSHDGSNKTPSRPATQSRPAANKGKAVAHWAINDECMAPFSEDGLYYAAAITKLFKKGGVQMATVTYTDYGNTEDVLVDELQPMSAFTSIGNSSAMDATPAAATPRKASTPKTITSKSATKSRPAAAPQQQAHTPTPSAGYAPSLPLPDDDDLANLLMAWYFSGYYTGLYQAKRQYLQSQHQ